MSNVFIKALLSSAPAFPVNKLAYSSNEKPLQFPNILLLVNEKMRISDYSKLIAKLKGCGSRTFAGIKSHDNWNAELRAEKIKVLQTLIEPAFVLRNGVDVVSENWTSQIDNLLHKSSIEGSQYDFKIGFHDLKTKKFNEDLVKKCIEILTAAVNLGPKTKGYILVGVADNKKSAEVWKKTYGEDYLEMEEMNFCVVGLNKEIESYYKSSDDFIRKIKQVINICNVSEEVKKYILMNIKLVKYYRKDILVLELQSDNEPVSYDDKIYVREGNDTRELSTPLAIKLSKKFVNV